MVETLLSEQGGELTQLRGELLEQLHLGDGLIARLRGFWGIECPKYRGIEPEAVTEGGGLRGVTPECTNDVATFHGRTLCQRSCGLSSVWDLNRGTACEVLPAWPHAWDQKWRGRWALNFRPCGLNHSSIPAESSKPSLSPVFMNNEPVRIESTSQPVTVYDPLHENAVLYPKPLKHNRVVAGLARAYLDLRTRGLNKVIFSATTGRSGTMSLARILAAVPHTFASHEVYPIMNGQWLKAASYGNTEEVRRYYERVKAIYIRRAAIGMRHYAEMNHLFLKTFIEYAVEDFGERLEVIHLVRPAIEVALSIYQRKDWPGTEKGNKWWLDYHAPTNLIQLSKLFDGAGEFSHPFYKALWYWYETQARVSDWQERLPQVRFHHFKTQWMNDFDRVRGLLDGLDMPYDFNRLKQVVGTCENANEGRGREAALDGALAREMQGRFEALIGWDGADQAAAA